MLFSVEKNLIKLIALINAVLANVGIDLFSCSLTMLTSWLECVRKEGEKRIFLKWFIVLFFPLFICKLFYFEGQLLDRTLGRIFPGCISEGRKNTVCKQMK